MNKENINKSKYTKAISEVIYFENEDVITTSGCNTWSNKNGVSCHYNLTSTY